MPGELLLRLLRLRLLRLLGSLGLLGLRFLFHFSKCPGYPGTLLFKMFQSTTGIPMLGFSRHLLLLGSRELRASLRLDDRLLDDRGLRDGHNGELFKHHRDFMRSGSDALP